MHAVVACRGPYEDRRIRLSCFGELIGRDLLEECPVFRLVRISILGDPTRAGEELAVATHVEQRNDAPDRAKALRIARQHIADEKPTVAAAVAGEPLRARDSPSNEIGCHSGEVVLRALLALADARFVPGRAELAATANVGDHIDTAALEPSLAHSHGIGRK